MKILNIFILLIILQSNVVSQCTLQPDDFGQCKPSDFPQDAGMYDLYVCSSGSKHRPMKLRVIHKKVEFYFDTDADIMGQVDIINFDDGLGEQNVPSDWDGHWTVEYPTTGIKKIRLKGYEDDNDGDDVLEEKGDFEITIKGQSDPYVSPDIIWELETENAFSPPAGQYPPFSPYSIASTGQANAYVRLADGHTQVTRPIIFVEGLDFGEVALRDPNKNNKVIRYGSNGWDVFETGAAEAPVVEGDEELFKNVPKQFADFHDAKYDVILLDFKDGADYIEKNAELLKLLIQKINNEEKVPDINGIIHPNIVVGASMGSIIARYTLAKMEQDGIDHCTSTYASFDGPHQGANISLGLQSLLWFSSAFSDEDDEDARVQWRYIKRPAARQLLNQNLLGLYQSGKIALHAYEVKKDKDNPFDKWDTFHKSFEDFDNMNIDYNFLRSNFREKLANVGYPQQTWNIAIANGNPDGNNIGFEAGAKILDADLWAGTLINHKVMKVHIWSTPGGSYSDSDFEDSFSSESTLFYGKQPTSTYLFPSDLPDAYGVAAIELIDDIRVYDNVPGSVRDDIASSVVPTLNKLPANDCNPVNYFLPNITFIPTVSALDLSSDNLFYPVESLEEDEPNPSLTPFSRIYYPNEYQPHVKTNDGNRLWTNEQVSLLGDDLTPFGILPNSNGAVYNFGLAKKTLKSINIKEDGYLRINDEGNTGYLSDYSAVRERFDVYTSACDDSEVIIEKGGYLILGSEPGELNRMGNLYITDGSRLHVQGGGKLRLQRGSQVIVEEGGILEIDAEANIDLWWSNSSIHIKNGGSLIINGDFTFTGSGYFQFDAGNIFTLSSGAEAFKLTGEYEEDPEDMNRFIKLNAGAELNIENKGLELIHGIVEYENGSSIKVDNGYVRAHNIIFNGQSETACLGINNPDWATVKYCTFNNAADALIVSDFSGSGTSDFDKVLIDETNFNNCAIGSVIHNSSIVYFNRCNFNIDAGYDLAGSAAIEGYDVNNINLSYTDIQNYPYIQSGSGAINLKNVSLLTMDGGSIDNSGIGIHSFCLAPELNKSNVLLRKRATISNCVTGIEIKKGGVDMNGEDYGLVMLDCARLINNETGIKGVDILLDIDGCVGPDCTSTSSNHFEMELQGKYFDLIFVDRSDTEEILARKNYWSPSPNLNGSPIFVNYRLKKGVLNGNLGCYANFASGSIDLDFSDALSEAPTGCNSGGVTPSPLPPKTTSIDQFAGSPYDCRINIGREEELVAQKYYAADFYLKNEEIGIARENYATLAAVPYQTRSNSDQMCRHYIDVARVMSYALGEETASLYSDDNSYNDMQSNASLDIWPNPTAESIMVSFGTDLFTVEIVDLLGRVKLIREIRNNERLIVRDWEPGIYLINAKDSKTGKVESSKFIVN